MRTWLQIAGIVLVIALAAAGAGAIYNAARGPQDPIDACAKIAHHARIDQQERVDINCLSQDAGRDASQQLGDDSVTDQLLNR